MRSKEKIRHLSNTPIVPRVQCVLCSLSDITGGQITYHIIHKKGQGKTITPCALVAAMCEMQQNIFKNILNHHFNTLDFGYS